MYIIIMHITRVEDAWAWLFRQAFVTDQSQLQHASVTDEYTAPRSNHCYCKPDIIIVLIVCAACVMYKLLSLHNYVCMYSSMLRNDNVLNF